jgi:glycogen synthase
VEIMRLLFLSNYYPPFAIGGYEQWCHEVAVELISRGHDVRVLSSRASGNGRSSSVEGVQVHRSLRLEVEGGVVEASVQLLRRRILGERANMEQVRQLIDDFRPDAGLIWGMWNVPHSVPALVEQLLPGRVAYYFCDYWPSLANAYLQHWQAPAARWVTRWPKSIMASLFGATQAAQDRPSLRFEHPICVSQAVRSLLVQSGVPVKHARIVHGGIHVDSANNGSAHKRRADGSRGLSLLYLGRLVPEKGVHTAISALGSLPAESRDLVTLDIIGRGDARYERHLRALARELGPQQPVRFRGSVPPDQVSRIMPEYDALVFPSEWEEPFARTVLEGMAAGLTVIGTTTGGTGEVLVEGETGLTFPAGDAGALATQIHRLIREPELGRELARTATGRVEQQFTVGRMVDEMEDALRRVANSAVAAGRGASSSHGSRS